MLVKLQSSTPFPSRNCLGLQQIKPFRQASSVRVEGECALVRAGEFLDSWVGALPTREGHGNCERKMRKRHGAYLRSRRMDDRLQPLPFASGLFPRIDELTLTAGDYRAPSRFRLRQRRERWSPGVVPAMARPTPLTFNIALATSRNPSSGTFGERI